MNDAINKKMKTEGEDFKFDIEGDELKFWTFSYRADKGSVLSPMIYSHELSAMLASALPAAAAFLIVKAGLIRYAAALAAYALGFYFFRTFVFKKRYLSFSINKKTGEVFLNIPFTANKTFRTDEIEKIEAKTETFLPENAEGLKQVEKIALHHHTVLPELDKPVDFFSVRVRLKNGADHIIYSGRKPETAADITIKIKEFLSLNVIENA